MGHYHPSDPEEVLYAVKDDLIGFGKEYRSAADHRDLLYGQKIHNLKVIRQLQFASSLIMIPDL